MTNLRHMDSIDEMMALKALHNSSIVIAQICERARATASVYMIENPDALIFDDEMNTIDCCYDAIFSSAVDEIKRYVQTVRTRVQNRRAAMRVAA